MGTLSKHFYAATRDKTCRDMLHPGHTCWQAGQVYLWQGLIGAMRHYLPGAVVSARNDLAKGSSSVTCFFVRVDRAAVPHEPVGRPARVDELCGAIRALHRRRAADDRR